jgi:hypothetical protein
MGIIWHSKKDCGGPSANRQTDVALRLNCQRDGEISIVAQRRDADDPAFRL